MNNAHGDNDKLIVNRLIVTWQFSLLRDFFPLSAAAEAEVEAQWKRVRMRLRLRVRLKPWLTEL